MPRKKANLERKNLAAFKTAIINISKNNISDKTIGALAAALEAPEDKLEAKIRECEKTIRSTFSEKELFAFFNNFFRKISITNSLPASLDILLGIMFANGLPSVISNHKFSEEYFKKAAAKGSVVAQDILADMYIIGAGQGNNIVLKNHAEAFKLLTSVVEKKYGNGRAEFNLAKFYYSGTIVDKDTKKFVELVKSSAELGYIHAQFKLASFYENGDFDVAKDNKEALKWYTKAAKNGHASSQFKLGSAYEHGDFDVTKDDKEALKWHTKAAKNGHSLSELRLGSAYLYGHFNLDINPLKALGYFSKAAEKHNSDALFFLGKAYDVDYKNFGIGQNKAKALEYYKEADRLGNISASARLAKIYADNPQNISTNSAEMYEWFGRTLGRAINNPNIKQDILAALQSSFDKFYGFICPESQEKSELDAQQLQELLDGPNKQNESEKRKEVDFVTSPSKRRKSCNDYSEETASDEKFQKLIRNPKKEQEKSGEKLQSLASTRGKITAIRTHTDFVKNANERT